MKIKFRQIAQSFCSGILIQAIFIFSPDLSLGQTPNLNTVKKINGVSFFSPKQAMLNLDMVASVKTSNAEWIAFVPEVTLERATLGLRPDEENPWWGKTMAGTAKGIELAKQAGFKVMLKPHMVLSPPIPFEEKNTYFDFFYWGRNKPTYSEKDKTNGATWRGDFKARNEADWIEWERGYQSYILRLAQLADSMDVDLFSIGSELRESAVQRVVFWQQLIKKVRNIYSGQLTYSANWDEYEKITFWRELDYIGIDAYFPISESATPTVTEAEANWQPILQQLKTLSNKYQRQILITEFGYRNVPYAGLEPWIHNKENDPVNHLSQVNLYEAFFRTFQQEYFIAGSFLWQWFYMDKGPEDTDFSPQGKPGLEVVRKWYGGGE